jgi:hypothetical protein
LHGVLVWAALRKYLLERLREVVLDFCFHFRLSFWFCFRLC